VAWGPSLADAIREVRPRKPKKRRPEKGGILGWADVESKPRTSGAGPRGPVGDTGRITGAARVSGASSDSPLTAALDAYVGLLPDPRAGRFLPGEDLVEDLLEESGENLVDVAEDSELARVLRGENPDVRGFAKPPTDKEIRAVADIAALTPAGAGVKGALAAKTASKAIKASQAAAAKGGGRAVRAFAGRRAGQGVVARTASKAEPAVIKAARTAAVRRGAKAAQRLPKPVRVAGGVAARGATLPVKRPFTTPVAAQLPAAAIAGDPSELGKAFTGEGALASIASGAGEAASAVVPGEVAKNLVKDAFNLPAVVLPSTYLPIAGAVEASRGDSSRLEKLLKEYEETGLLPAALRGDVAGISKALREHPLYSALEVSGGAAVAGRGAGAVARGATRGRVGGTARPPLTIPGLEKYGNVRGVAGNRFGSGVGSRYSPDLLRQGVQRALDRRRESREGGMFATPREADRALRRLGDRFAYKRTQVDRVARENMVKAMDDAKPSGRATQAVVAQVAQGIVRSPETFADDLRTYRTQLEEIYNSGSLTKAEQKGNRDMVNLIDRAIEKGDPEAAVKSAKVFIELHGEQVDRLVKQGLLDPEQATRAALVPFLRVWMDGSYGKPKNGDGPPQLLDRDGNAISTEAILEEAARQGVELPGFLTHRPSRKASGGTWYRPFFPDRQKLPTAARTGASLARGTYDASYKALVEQAVRTRSIAGATESFDAMIREFGIPAAPSIKNLADAHGALLDPEKYGMTFPPGVEMQPVRTTPLIGKKREADAAGQIQGLLDPEHNPGLERLPQRLLGEMTSEGPGPIAFLPRTLVKRLEEHHAMPNQGERLAGLLVKGFKGAVLPFSISKHMGDFVDNWMKVALSGSGPGDIMLGRKVAKALPEDARESVVSGLGFGSVSRVHPYRSSSQFKGSSLEGLADGLHNFRMKPGPKQAINFYIKARDTLLEISSRLSERVPQYAALGKEARREIQAKAGQWNHALTISDKAFKDLVDGYRGTDAQVDLALAVEGLLGNWGKNGPSTRRWLTNFMPFWMWARASSRFVLLTLPAHHPIKTGLIAAAAEMTEAERKKLGLDKYADEPYPGYLQGNVPVGAGITRNLPKYQSFGSFSDYPHFLGDLFFAQGSSFIDSLKGMDFTGEQLADENGRPLSEADRAKVAILAGGEAFVPGFSLMQSIISGETGKLSPAAQEQDQEKIKFLRSLRNMQQITVPISEDSEGGGSSSWGRGSSSSGPSSSSSNWGRPSSSSSNWGRP